MNGAEAKANELKVSFENLCGIVTMLLCFIFGFNYEFQLIFSPNKIVESAKGEIDAFDKSENELINLEQALLDEESVPSPLSLSQCLIAVAIMFFCKFCLMFEI
jgi:hypothetical protein